MALEELQPAWEGAEGRMNAEGFSSQSPYWGPLSPTVYIVLRRECLQIATALLFSTEIPF